MSLIRFRHPQSFSMYTPCNRMNFIWCWTHLSYTYVQIISYVQMLLWCCFAVQYLLQTVEDHVIQHIRRQTFRDNVMSYSLSLVRPRNHLKPVCATDRPRLWKHCYHSVCFPVVVWSPSVTCLALHKDIWMCAAPPYPQISYWNCILFLINFC